MAVRYIGDGATDAIRQHWRTRYGATAKTFNSTLQGR